MSRLYAVDGGRWVDCGPKVTGDILAGRDKFQRFDDVWNGLLFRLARDPEAGYQDPSHMGVWIMETKPTNIAELPRIAVLYRFDSTKIFILRLVAKLD